MYYCMFTLGNYKTKLKFPAQSALVQVRNNRYRNTIVLTTILSVHILYIICQHPWMECPSNCPQLKQRQLRIEQQQLRRMYLLSVQF